ncbi:type I-C CRISPR-associated protein Cas8c/Csd1 [Acetivibrio straminisolvens]|uniref:CRISPR-associated protein n=1 Tax=Acetivibrio straminisolvens JCM 21531 TaxID=1294263 RepID=W4V7K1_9FIRM|nr:type I-C CRISPR-associated protein Cas8c/Csd1 [Acetivibrio straminisolvens]GAE89355.1 CRISPR-associated protein [Acetivibrio straminisolvens JCM 21531]
MILQALSNYYNTLINSDSGVAPPGYSNSKVSHILLISTEGELLDVIPIYKPENKKLLPRYMILPQEVQRTSGKKANFLYDNSSYVLGICLNETTKQPIVDISIDNFNIFKEFNNNRLKDIDDIKAKAFLKFINNWNPRKWQENPIIFNKANELCSGYNIVFKIEGEGFLHESSFVSELIAKAIDEDNDNFTAQCLVTGEFGNISRTHNLIKGVKGAQSSGAAIVSFNNESFKSYGKDQSFNAPVSKKATFEYTTALNYLLNSKLNSLTFADTTIVFWAEKKDLDSKEEIILSWSLDPFEPDISENENDDKKQFAVDRTTARQAKEILENIMDGISVKNSDFRHDTKCYILGLAPNAARISVRFWEVNSFGEVLNKITTHYKDIYIVGSKKFGNFIPPWRLLKEVAAQGKTENIPPLLAGQLLYSILTGAQYPYNLYTMALSRVRKNKRNDEKGETANPISVGIIKAYLIRKFRTYKQKDKEEMITVSLNESLTENAYLLGRLFSLLEKAQKDAIGKEINSGISDKYFGTASSTPAVVFPILLRLYRHHKSKLDKEGKGTYIDIKIQEVMNKLESFPAYLNLEHQGLFVLGYYHQNQANYIKKEDKEEIK